MADNTSITVRFYAGAAAAAGLEEYHLPLNDGAQLCQVTQDLARRIPALEPILPLCTFLSVHEEHVLNPDDVVATGDTIEVLPPFAGG